MSDKGITKMTEDQMIDVIELYFVGKLGIGGSANISVGLFMKLAPILKDEGMLTLLGTA